jgi:hypothetical protein
MAVSFAVPVLYRVSPVMFGIEECLLWLSSVHCRGDVFCEVVLERGMLAQTGT